MDDMDLLQVISDSELLFINWDTALYIDEIRSRMDRRLFGTEE